MAEFGDSQKRRVYHGMLERVKRSAEKNFGRLLTNKETRSCEAEVRRTMDRQAQKERELRG